MGSGCERLCRGSAAISSLTRVIAATCRMRLSLIAGSRFFDFLSVDVRHRHGPPRAQVDWVRNPKTPLAECADLMARAATHVTHRLSIRRRRRQWWVGVVHMVESDLAHSCQSDGPRLNCWVCYDPTGRPVCAHTLNCCFLTHPFSI